MSIFAEKPRSSFAFVQLACFTLVTEVSQSAH